VGDEDVHKDKLVQKFAFELSDPAKGDLKGFPHQIKTKASLI
jgi:hypothetical protein